MENTQRIAQSPFLLNWDLCWQFQKFRQIAANQICYRGRFSAQLLESQSKQIVKIRDREKMITRYLASRDSLIFVMEFFFFAWFLEGKSGFEGWLRLDPDLHHLRSNVSKRNHPLTWFLFCYSARNGLIEIINEKPCILKSNHFLFVVWFSLVSFHYICMCLRFKIRLWLSTTCA